MPLKRLGYGLVVIALVSVAAMASVTVASKHADAGTVSAILAFAGSVVGGLFVILKRLEDIEDKQERTHAQTERTVSLVEDLHQKIDKGGAMDLGAGQGDGTA